MPRPRLARARLTPRHAPIALAVCVVFALAAATPAAAVTRTQAAKRALAALGSKKSGKPVIVFGLSKTLHAGARVTQAGGAQGAPVVGAFAHQRAFFFYEDSGPFRPYKHPRRVALVGAGNGKVKLSKTIRSQPLVNGKLPVFLQSPKGYRAPEFRVFARAQAFAGDPSGSGSLGPNSPPKADKQDVIAKQNVPKHVTLTGTDGDGDLLLFAITKQPDHGTLSGQTPDVTYTPDPGYLGRDDFSFKTNDGSADSNTAKVSVDVVPLGSPPTVTTSTGCTAYTEQRPAVAVDGQLTVADPDDTSLDSARVRINGSFQDGDDLLFTDQNGIDGAYDDATGVLTLNGTAPLATYQAALRTVRYRNLSATNPAPTRDVQFTVNDAGSDSAPATKQICVGGGDDSTNDRPIGETSEGVLDYVENDGPVPVDAAFDALDADSASLSGATIQFTASQPADEDEVFGPITAPSVTTFIPAEDELAFADQSGITGSYDDSNGILTLTGTASVADYEAAIRSVTYENSSENPSDAPRALRFQLTDSSGASSSPRGRGILVTPVNDAPVVTTTEGSASYVGTGPATTIDAGLTVGDVDDTSLEAARVAISSGFEAGDDLAYTNQLGIHGVYHGATGVLELSGTASVADYETALRSVAFRHTPGNASGSRTVDFTVNDGDLDSAPASKGIEVNDKPIVTTTSGALAYSEGDGAVAVDDGVDVTDADSTSLTGATVQISGNLAPDEDALAVSEQNGISGFYESSSGTLTLSGTASVADYEAALRSVTYENSSDAPSTATRTVTIQVDDGATSNNLSDPATRDVEVTSVNDAPVVSTSDGSTAYTIGDSSGTAIDAGLTTSDADDASLEGAQVSIGSDFQAGDELVYDEQLGITGGYDSDTGVLTLTGTASVADYQTALRSIKFRTSAETPSLSRTIEFIVNDGDADSAAATKTIDLAAAPLEAAPVVTTSDGTTSYTVGDPAATVDAGLTVTDADDTELESARVQISGFETGDDLVFVDKLGIQGVYNTATGVLTLTGTASVADYETALRSIEYRYTGDNPSGSRGIQFTVNDGDLDSNVATRGVDISSPAL
jgi:hypothetical protein